MLSDTGENDCAREIKSIAGRLGLVAGKDARQKRTDYTKVTDYLNEQLQKERLELVVPGEEAALKLSEAGDEMKHLLEILEKDLPVWGFQRRNLGYDPEGQMAVLGLVRLLCADSLYALTQNRPEEAVRDLDASMKLAASLEEKSTITGAIYFLVSYKLVVGASRFLPSYPDRLASRISAVDPRKIMKEGFVSEIALMRQITEDPSGLFLDDSNRSSFGFYLSVPYLRLCGAGYSKAFLEYTLILESADPCKLSAGDINLKIMNDIPAWNIIAKIALPNLQDAWGRANKITLDRDLSLLIMEIRDEKMRHGELPGSITPPPVICPGTSWKYARDGEHYSLFFDGNFASGSEKAPTLSLKWEE